MKKEQELKKVNKTAKVIEKAFGKVDIYRLLEGEAILGCIDELPVRKNNALGRAKATVTNKRLIVESEIYDNTVRNKRKYKGRDAFYYETDLDKIESISFYSSDVDVRRGNILAMLFLLIIAVAMISIDIILIKTYYLCAIGAIPLISGFLFTPRKARNRTVEFLVGTRSGELYIGDDDDADVTLVVTNESLDKIALLAKGIRKAQATIK